MNLQTLSDKLKSGELDPVSLLQQYLQQINRHDGKIHAFIEVEKEEALKQAEASLARRKAGRPLSEFDGIPIGIKDNIVQKDRKSACASKLLEGYTSPYSSTVVEKLWAHGLVTIGRLNMDEFAMGSSTENSSIQVTRNPWDTDRVPGGSSGGSAAAVSAGFVPVSLGSDTGGSIRQPAAFCGVTGLKPTYGSVSRYGLVAFASSLDQIGPFGKSVDDVRLIHEIISGYDPRDATSVPDNKRNFQMKNISELKIGIPEDLLKGCEPAVLESFNQVKDFLEKNALGKNAVKKVQLKNQKYGIPVYYITANSEASANLARFDGIRYGRRAKEKKDLIELYAASRTEGFGPEVKRRILLGTYALSSGYYDAFYGRAQKVRRLIKMDYEAAFKDVDLIILPTTPTTSFKVGEKVDDPISMYLSDLLTVGASLSGIPAISVPGPVKGLPVGIQIQGPSFSEPLIFALALEIEKAFPHSGPVFK